MHRYSTPERLEFKELPATVNIQPQASTHTQILKRNTCLLNTPSIAALLQATDEWALLLHLLHRPLLAPRAGDLLRLWQVPPGRIRPPATTTTPVLISDTLVRDTAYHHIGI
jgi:hypothetical protein